MSTPPTQLPTVQTSRKPVLLIVDDEPGPRESLRFIFKDRYECALATCGREGIEYARAHPVDVAILDVKMPDLSGIEVLRELKEIDPCIECVLLTGYETIETARAAIHFGAAEYLNKPFDVFAIREIIQKCLERSQQRRNTEANLQALQQMNDELSRSLAENARTETAKILSAGVVHEINNPLTIIAGYVQLLNRDLAKLANGDSGISQTLQQRLAIIQREIQHCRDIAQRFLRFSRSPAADFELVDVAPLIDDAALLLRAHPDAGQVQILAQSHYPSLPLRANPVEIIQILLNLGVNALHAMNGKGTLRFTADRAFHLPHHYLHQSAAFDPRIPLVGIAVTDTGCGIAPENIEKVLKPHFTTKPHGTGLGLAIVGELINKYRGAISVESVVGQGTTFNLYLPMAV